MLELGLGCLVHTPLNITNLGLFGSFSLLSLLSNLVRLDVFPTNSCGLTYFAAGNGTADRSSQSKFSSDMSLGRFMLSALKSSFFALAQVL